MADLFCTICEDLVDETSTTRAFIVGLDGRATHADCLTKWRDDNPVPEEEP